MLSIDRIRVPEILFQPSLCGLNQSGIVESVGRVLKDMPPEVADRCAEGGLLATGGNAAFPGKFPIPLTLHITDRFSPA